MFEKYYYKFIFNFTSTKKRFTTIYEKNFWSSKELLSSPGSDLGNTVTIRKELPGILKKYEVESFLGLPCGDFHWMKLLDLNEVNYIGGDIVKKLIESNILKYGNLPRVKFEVLDLVNGNLGEADVAIVRDCSEHLFNDLISQ